MISTNSKICIATSIVSTTIFIILYTWNKNQSSRLYLKIIEEDDTELSIKQSEGIGVNDDKLFNLNFNYILNSNTCNNNSKVLAVFIVTSYFGNIETRSAMRRAFSHHDLKHLKVKRIFLLGIAPHDKYTTQKTIINEAERFNDIVQGNFVEAYRNLTYKHVMGLNWAANHCNGAKYIIKMDDDIVVSIKKLVSLLTKIMLPKDKLLAGYILKGMLPIREPANKWYVTKDEYNQSTYPQFISGWFYITNPATATTLVKLAQTQKYFWIDDLYITGIIAKKLKIRHYDMSKYFAVHSEFLECCINDLRKNLDCDFLVGPNGGDNNLFYTFNEAVKHCDRISRKCDIRLKAINETCVAERKINLGRGHAIIETYSLH